jgi:ribonuclease VapC
MIVDSSAIVSIALAEPEADAFVEALGRAKASCMSGGTWIELAAVAVRRGLFTPAWLERTIEQYGISIEPVTVEQAQIGHEAYQRYGLGSGHPARFNLGDCFAYALARATGEPLLFKGDDFSQTDIIAALPPKP